MTAVWVVLGFVSYMLAALVTFRLEYVREYETVMSDRLDNTASHVHAESMARMQALCCAAIAPLAIWPSLFLAYGRPTPPSLAKRLETANAIRLDAIERELQIGPYRRDPLDEL